ncbi:hypothetical protein TNCV_4197841 [Trichonephila clavipes]|nr:hypothetical protein TNCV_4197841 [Trichonephila clavipes]
MDVWIESSLRLTLQLQEMHLMQPYNHGASQVTCTVAIILQIQQPLNLKKRVDSLAPLSSVDNDVLGARAHNSRLNDMLARRPIRGPSHSSACSPTPPPFVSSPSRCDNPPFIVEAYSCGQHPTGRG